MHIFMLFTIKTLISINMFDTQERVEVNNRSISMNKIEHFHARLEAKTHSKASSFHGKALIQNNSYMSKNSQSPTIRVVI